MKIACLGWGSLIWNPRELPIHTKWFDDGPYLPIEYTRQSLDGRMTLALTPGMDTIRSLWCLMKSATIEESLKALHQRECPKKNIYDGVASWPDKEREGVICYQIIDKWAKELNIDAVIWTILKPKFENNEGTTPTIEQVIDYLNALDGEKRAKAETYVRRTPIQIDTKYRRAVELHLGWLPI